MNGLYLYGICPSDKINPAAEGSEFRPKRCRKLSDKNLGEGIGGGKVFHTPYKNIEAIVSQVSLKEFWSSEIQRRATEDLEWIKNKALIHERVIEAAMNNSDGLVIPMKFGTIFKDKKSLINSLKKGYLKFKNLLGSLRGKEERSVKIYLKSQLLENEIKKNLPAIQNKLKEAEHLPAGRQYFLEEEINEMAKREVKKSLNSYIVLFLEMIKQAAEELKENKILGKEFTQRNDPMVFNGAFLVKKEKVERFKMEIQKLQTKHEKMGFTFESSGPWPPYNFV